VKLSLDTIGYGGYFTAKGESLSLEEAVRRAAKFGYDAACIDAHRPLGFPLDLDANRRRRIRGLYEELDLDMGAIVCCTSFLEGNRLLSAEQCSPIIVQGHKLGTVETVDERYMESLTYMRGLLDKIGAYTGHKRPPAPAPAGFGERAAKGTT
jgi:sugar phosphate isomerase/epimerase